MVANIRLRGLLMNGNPQAESPLDGIDSLGIGMGLIRFDGQVASLDYAA